VLVVIFWTCVLLIVYHHALYPPLLRFLGRRVKHSPNVQLEVACSTPSITLIVPAHNEALVIEQKVANLQDLTYSRLRCVIALDGCTDDTAPKAKAAIAKAPVSARFSLMEYPNNVGKVGVLNREIAEARSEIVVLSDASAVMPSTTLIQIAKHFAEPRVGVVCGTYSIQGDDGERLYWKYQTQVKASEAALAAPMGAHGALYAFRRCLWSPLPDDTINDDFHLPMAIVLKGYRAVYDPTIVATELERTRRRQEFRRRVRIGAGNLQQVVRLIGLGHPRRGWLAFVFWSGKGLRGLMPFVLLAATLTNAILAAAGNWLHQCVLLAQLILLGLAWGSQVGTGGPKCFRPVSYLVEGHVASTVGAILWVVGLKRHAWRFSMSAKERGR
jgi:cellulose synthase/poly-beta-1,6-N-acetylglucosamine synthase-like glycosyltransferase